MQVAKPHQRAAGQERRVNPCWLPEVSNTYMRGGAGMTMRCNVLHVGRILTLPASFFLHELTKPSESMGGFHVDLGVCKPLPCVEGFPPWHPLLDYSCVVHSRVFESRGLTSTPAIAVWATCVCVVWRRAGLGGSAARCRCGRQCMCGYARLMKACCWFRVYTLPKLNPNKLHVLSLLKP